MTDLGTLGGSASFATDINARGQIVGFSNTASGVEHAFLWEKGKMTDLGTLAGDLTSRAWGINKRGQIVGESNDTTGNPHAVLWTK
jgi:probable HAF family extracellular repeat protein